MFGHFTTLCMKGLRRSFLCSNFNTSRPSISESCMKIKIKLNFIFTLLCGASKSFMKAFKDFNVKNDLAPDIMKEVFQFKNRTYNIRSEKMPFF